MKMKLSYKLLSAFFMILGIVVGAMLLSQYIFQQNIKNYIHQVDLGKLQQLVPALQEEYIARGSWEGIAADPQKWQRLMSTAWAPPEFPPPPPFEDLPADGSKPPQGQHRPYGPPGLFFMDAQHRSIIGVPAPSDQRQLLAVEVDGHIVGWLGLHQHEPFKSGPPAELLERQANQFFLLGGVVIGLTALLAFLFSRHLLKPVQRLTRGTRELAQRNFDVRIESTSGDELGQLAENFNTMAQTLANYEKMRHQWLTDISHELRTPLAVLRGEIEALQDGVRDPTPRNMTSLHAEILRISKLVEDLHQLSIADSDNLLLNKQLISPVSVLETIVRDYRNRFAQCRLNLDLMLEGLERIRIKGDADRLAQVFINILENACKYVRPPGVLIISGQTSEHHLILSFQDSGPGVPIDALPRLFDRLYRVDISRNRNSGGSGLGLCICRQIIENHKGRIWAENCPLGGLFIGISLPLADMG